MDHQLICEWLGLDSQTWPPDHYRLLGLDPGEADPDRINIDIALAGLRRYSTLEDRALLPEIEALIEATHYPYKIESDKLDLLGQIIRDADLAQALSPVWIQQIVIGLAQEWRSTPLQVLKAQVPFFTALRFTTFSRLSSGWPRNGDRHRFKC